MEKVCIGKLVTTHGVRGEVRISSNFELKDKVFVIGNILYIKNNEYEITSHRVHKGYDMVTFKGVNDINEVIPLKQSLVYTDRNILELNDNDYVYEDLVGMKVILNDTELGAVMNYTVGLNKLIEVKGESKTFYIPIVDDFIDKVVKSENMIYVKESVRELI